MHLSPHRSSLLVLLGRMSWQPSVFNQIGRLLTDHYLMNEIK